MIHTVKVLPPGALPISAGPISLAMTPSAYVAEAERQGYLVLNHRLRAYLVRAH